MVEEAEKSNGKSRAEVLSDMKSYVDKMGEYLGIMKLFCEAYFQKKIGRGEEVKEIYKLLIDASKKSLNHSSLMTRQYL